MATYYVSGQNGNDSNNGTTPALARKTIDSGLSLCSSAGDILRIGPGTYREILTSADFAGMNGSAVGNEGKVIGDPDASHFTDDIAGPVRITRKLTDELDNGTTSSPLTSFINSHKSLLANASGSNSIYSITTISSGFLPV